MKDATHMGYLDHLLGENGCQGLSYAKNMERSAEQAGLRVQDDGSEMGPGGGGV